MHRSYSADIEKWLTEAENKNSKLSELLSLASAYGHIEYIKKYLSMGGNIDGEDYLSSPLYNTIGNDNFDAADFLIKNGANINKYPEIGIYFISPDYDDYQMTYFELGNKISPPKMPALTFLIENGVNLNVLSKEGYSVFDEAIKCLGAEEYIIDFLVKNGADINIKNGDGKTILDVVIQSYPKFIDFLKQIGAKTSEELRQENKNV